MSLSVVSQPKPVGLRASMLTADEICNRPPRAFLIEDLIAPDSLVVLFGRPGSGKTFVALDIALSVANGRSWMGKSVLQGQVLYIVAEGTAGLSSRLSAWQGHFGLPISGGLCPVKFIAKAVNLTRPEECSELLDIVVEEQPFLVIFDTLARCISGADENSGKDMGAVVDLTDRIRKESRAAVMFVGHPSKSDSGVLRGHSSIEGAADTMIAVSKSTDNNMNLRVTKQKDGASETLKARLLPGDRSCVVIPSADGGHASETASGASANVNDAEIVHALTQHGQLSPVRLMAVTGISESTLHRRLRQMATDGRIEKGVGSKYRLVSEGKWFDAPKTATTLPMGALNAPTLPPKSDL